MLRRVIIKFVLKVLFTEIIIKLESWNSKRASFVPPHSPRWRQILNWKQDWMRERAETKSSVALEFLTWMERAKCEVEIKLHMDYYLLKELTSTGAARCDKFPLINSWNCSYFITLVLIVWWKIYARVKHHRTKLTRLDSIPANNVVAVIVARRRRCRGSRVERTVAQLQPSKYAIKLF